MGQGTNRVAQSRQWRGVTALLCWPLMPDRVPSCSLHPQLQRMACLPTSTAQRGGCRCERTKAARWPAVSSLQQKVTAAGWDVTAWRRRPPALCLQGHAQVLLGLGCRLNPSLAALWLAVAKLAG